MKCFSMSIMNNFDSVTELDAMVSRLRSGYSAEQLAWALGLDAAVAAKQQRIDFALAVKAAREIAGLSQRKLAKLVGMQQNDLSRLEKFKTNPTSDTQAKLCHALGIKVSYTVTGVPAGEVVASAKTKRELQKTA